MSTNVPSLSINDNHFGAVAVVSTLRFLISISLDIDMDVLDVNLRLLVAKLPSIGSIINLQSEITSLVGMSAGSAAYVNKVADLASKFGTGLSAGGYSLDSLISGAVSDLAAGLDLCANVPNFELPVGATEAEEKAKEILGNDYFIVSVQNFEPKYDSENCH